MCTCRCRSPEKSQKALLAQKKPCLPSACPLLARCRLSACPPLSATPRWGRSGRECRGNEEDDAGCGERDNTHDRCGDDGDKTRDNGREERERDTLLRTVSRTQSHTHTYGYGHYVLNILRSTLTCLIQTGESCCLRFVGDSRADVIRVHDRQTDRLTDPPTDRPTDRPRPTDSPTDPPTDRPIDRSSDSSSTWSSRSSFISSISSSLSFRSTDRDPPTNRPTDRPTG